MLGILNMKQIFILLTYHKIPKAELVASKQQQN